ncbi:wax ester/triacylglycerol synthase domain-containing protein [Nonomuraea lactucae]|uniref:wax ester/triacylglycerol synthase domain-containing protein n=1 Tax=Nonomuraea lactucae TaxID=2249762 RepID=UPI000DE31E3C|nr:wax ester/triacylglycerol synthase domain-containing protein [Nonomuraea lactucae]
MQYTQSQDAKSTRHAVDRASAGDLLNLTIDVGPVPMHAGACLVLDTRPGYDLTHLRRLIARCVAAVPRLRQRLVATPPGYGRPVWVDDPAFDLDHHIQITACPPPGDEGALLDLAVAVISRPLTPSNPLWSMTLVTGLNSDRIGLIACFHHVLADGIGGLAVLGCLVDGAPSPPPYAFPRPAPPLRWIAVDAWRTRLRALARFPCGWPALKRAASELGTPRRAAPCSLNQPTGPRQRLATVTARLDDVRRYAHAHGGTVNDAVLAAITGAVRALLASRGESIPDLVVSIPVSARASTTATRLGNQVGVMPVRLPTQGSLPDRLERTAAITRARKSTAPGTSAELLAAVNRLLARLHILRRLLNRQHLIHTVVTNLRGPAEPLVIGGARMRTIIPISLTRGNVTVAFSVLSYAGILTVTIVADAHRVPDLLTLVTALRKELAEMART